MFEKNFSNKLNGSDLGVCDLNKTFTRRNTPTNNSLGCFILDEKHFTNPFYDYDRNLMDPGLCLIHCKDYNYTISALKNGNECRCGFQNGLKQQLDNETCNLDCIGNSTFKCGGEEVYTVYNTIIGLSSYNMSNISSDKKHEIINNLKNDVRYNGCFQDNPYCGRRLLNGTLNENIHMTIDSCINFCKNKGYTFAGLEIGSQCFCGNEYEPIRRLGDDYCSSSCIFNSSQICGGPLTLSIYDTEITFSNNTGITSSNNAKITSDNIIRLILDIVGLVILIIFIAVIILIIYKKHRKRKIASRIYKLIKLDDGISQDVFWKQTGHNI
ncbi:24550_t:CDS:2 [Cetraspora pellucida]|uniref:24550_t:CDS:1 n=1 Tax=Cetraspora pellucida TaxID=1433469 RepID=A0A9N9PBJ5_9GLOM|nr:24550_t:CDS:2 [Cetraspora pellucida]